MNRAFQGIWIPKEIWLCENLTMQEKIFLVEIESLDNNEGCTAGNQYFSKFFDLSTRRTSEIINSLVKKGFITCKMKYKEGTKQIEYRILNIARPPYPSIEKNNNGVWKETSKGYGRKPLEPIEENFLDNNTLYNNTDNNIYNNIVEAKPLSSKLDIDLIKNIIDYLNSRMKTNYKHTSKANQRVINARINEGYTLEDFKAVINNRIEEWAYTEMKQYIRPQTLFGTKFESYLNSCEKVIEVNEVKIEKKVTNEVDLELDDILSKFD